MPRAPGFYWVREPGTERAVVAEWWPPYTKDWHSSGWHFPGDDELRSEPDIVVLSDRLEEPVW